MGAVIIDCMTERQPVHLQAVAITRDETVKQPLKAAVDQADIDLDFTEDPDAALRRAYTSKIDAVILDLGTSADPEAVIDRLRCSPTNNGAVVFVVAADTDQGSHALEHGANMMIPKPVSPEAVRLCFRAAYNRMIEERRRYFRYTLNVAGLAQIDDEWQKIVISNVSDRGLLIESPKTVEAGSSLVVRYSIDDVALDVECVATAVWIAPNGRIGLKLTTIDPVTGDQLKNWLGDMFQQQLEAMGPALPN
jgi:DNA-binding response OmpR family regulator